MTTKRRLRLQSNALEYADIDYLDKLSDDDRKFMLDFIDGYYNNNHRKYEMFTDHESYETTMKKELYDITNSRNRCGQSRDNVKGNIVEMDKPIMHEQEAIRLENLLKDSYRFNTSEDMAILAGLVSFEDRVNKLVDDTLHQLSDYTKEHKYILIRFFSMMKRLTNDEKRRLNNEKKIAKERKDRESETL